MKKIKNNFKKTLKLEKYLKNLMKLDKQNRKIQKGFLIKILKIYRVYLIKNAYQSYLIIKIN